MQWSICVREPLLLFLHCSEKTILVNEILALPLQLYEETWIIKRDSSVGVKCCPPLRGATQRWSLVLAATLHSCFRLEVRVVLLRWRAGSELEHGLNITAFPLRHVFDRAVAAIGAAMCLFGERAHVLSVCFPRHLVQTVGVTEGILLTLNCAA